jgi:hypothetical protein
MRYRFPPAQTIAKFNCYSAAADLFVSYAENDGFC